MLDIVSEYCIGVTIAELQPCSRLKGRPVQKAVLGHQLHSLFMPAVNRRVRSDAPSRQAAQNCATLLSIDSHKLVKVRSIGAADKAGDSEVQAVFATGDSIRCTLPKDLQSQLLFRGSGFFVVAPASPAIKASQSKLLGPEPATNSGETSWTVLYVLADEDPPNLARQGHWPPQFEAEGIDGLSNGQTVDLRTVPKVLPPAHKQTTDAQQSSVLNKTFYDSDEDDEEHELGCACCPGGRNVVFRVY